jgi:hypothetical protein
LRKPIGLTHCRPGYLHFSPLFLEYLSLSANKDNFGSSKFTGPFTTIQRAGALAITGGLRSSSTDAPDACAFLLPVAAVIDKYCHRALVRMATLPADHPLFKQVKLKVNRSIRRHSAPLHQLLNRYDLDPKEVEKIPSAAVNPTQSNNLPLVVSIAEDRESSIDEANKATKG